MYEGKMEPVALAHYCPTQAMLPCHRLDGDQTWQGTKVLWTWYVGHTLEHLAEPEGSWEAAKLTRRQPWFSLLLWSTMAAS